MTAIAAIVVGGFGMLFSMGMLPAIAIPAFLGYIRRAKQAEIDERLGQIARSAALYYSQPRVDAGGAPLPPQFPTSTPVTPARSCSEHDDGRCPPEAEAWSHSTWRALDFAMTDPHYYRYQFVSNGSAFTARALGDLDGDGVFSTFERTGLGAPDGTVTLSAGRYEHLPSE